MYLTHSTAYTRFHRGLGSTAVFYILYNPTDCARYKSQYLLRPVRSASYIQESCTAPATRSLSTSMTTIALGEVGVAVRTHCESVFSMAHSNKLGCTCALEENLQRTCRLAVPRQEGQQECCHTTNADWCPRHHLGFQRATARRRPYE